MNVVLTNVVLGNTGDAAICQGIIEVLERRGLISHSSDVLVLDESSVEREVLYPGLRIRQQPGVRPRHVSRVARAVQPLRAFLACALWRVSPRLARSVAGVDAGVLSELARADVIVSTGGTYLVEVYRVWPRMLHLIGCRLLGPKIVMWTQSLGPYRRRSSRVLMRRLLRSVDLVLLRDAKSLRHLEDLGRPLPPHQLLVDVAFALYDDGADAAPSRGGRLALVSVRSWEATLDGRAGLDLATYERSMRAAADALLTREFAVTALSTCQGLPSYPIDDSAYAASVFAAMPDVRIDSEFHTPTELQTCLRAASLVVATRMHFAILALVSGCQVLAIAYEFKTVELFNRLGLGRYVVSMEDVTPEWIQGRLTELTEDPGAGRLSREQRRELVDEAIPADLEALFDRRNVGVAGMPA